MYELNQVLIKSKWGEYGLFQHNVNQCPYFPNDEAPLGLKTHKNQVLTAFAAFC